MKEKRVSKIIKSISVIFISTYLVSCDVKIKEGCLDVKAINYNKNSDNNCCCKYESFYSFRYSDTTYKKIRDSISILNKKIKIDTLYFTVNNKVIGFDTLTNPKLISDILKRRVEFKMEKNVVNPIDLNYEIYYKNIIIFNGSTSINYNSQQTIIL